MASNSHALSLATAAAGGSSSSCCCVPWHKQVLQRQNRVRAKSYTDADLARDMNALTVEQREVLAEEIHGVSDVPTETPSLVQQKIQDMHEAMKNIPKSTAYRDAWDRAVYLRPSLATDVDHLLMFLRTRRYDPFDAANWMLKYYDSKRQLWGDGVVPNKLTWDDLTEEEQAYVRKGVFLSIPKNYKTPGNSEKLNYYRVFRWDNFSGNPFPLIRSIIYAYMNEIIHNVEMQRGGVISVVDLRGEENLMASQLELLQFAGYCIPEFEKVPNRSLCIHYLLNNSQMAQFVHGITSIYPRDWRVRVRWHVGSWMEIQYSLRTFGIDIPVDCSLHNQENDKSPFSKQAIERQIRSFIESDELWRKSEEKYQHFNSTIAMYPNPQDIITGRNRKVTATWPGNIQLKKLIDSYAPLYLQLEDRREKTEMSSKVLKILQEEHKARFLVRNGDLSYWEALDDEEARLKVGQDLRDESRKLLNQMKKTLNSL